QQKHLAWSAVTCIRKRSNWGLICAPCAASPVHKIDLRSALNHLPHFSQGTREMGHPGQAARRETALAKTACILCLVFLFSVYIFASEPPSPAAYGVRMEQAWI